MHATINVVSERGQCRPRGVRVVFSVRLNINCSCHIYIDMYTMQSFGKFPPAMIIVLITVESNSVHPQRITNM